MSSDATSVVEHGATAGERAEDRAPAGASWSVKLAYGAGAAANNIKMRGISSFLMIFYNQVVGLDAAVVSTVIMVSLIFDAIFDPMIGQASDNFRSPWGRRHPFMYAAAVPVAALFFLLWNPPAWSNAALAIYLLVVLVGVRFFDTFFELPTAALAPELARRYDERTQLAAIRAFFGMVGGLAITALALNVLMKERPDGTGGVLARDGYFNYSIVASLVIFAVILVCCLGTHSQIPKLTKAPDRKTSLKAMVREAGQTLNNRAFVVLALASVLIAAGNGMASGLEMYWNLYFYRLSQPEILALATGAVVATVAGSMIVTRLSIWFGKRAAAIGLLLTSLVCTLSPLVLRASGAVTDPDQLFVILLPLSSAGTGCTVAALVLLTAMTMDVVEQQQVRTGRRSEGLLFAAENLVKKITSGFGVFASGVLLTLAHFPVGAERGQVPEGVMTTMVAFYIPAKVALIGVGALALLFYSISRKDHEDNLRALGAD